jgi:two-component system chemotaxis response regulator CheB/chemosensory pili system protein ChpB (putative protein-glutamate methylesterase)
MRVALLYPTSQHGNQLRDALKELGASVVYETAASSVDRDALENSGARVVVVNLGPDSDDYIDALYDVLDAGDYNVIFNEAHVTEALQGWDHARWARNLASKILKRPEVATPPRPPGAEAVPTPVQKSASSVPVADKPSTFTFDAAPAPVAAPTSAPAVVEPPTLTNVKPVEKPTMELEVPQEFRIEEAADSASLNIADLGEFAEGAGEIPSVTPAPLPTAPVEQRADADFAAELDALFAAADTAKTTPAPSNELDIGLPDDFDLSDLSAPAAQEETIELTDISLGSDSNVAELHDEFPAIFDQLDVAASRVPEATSDEFKPAPPRVVEEPKSGEPVLPPDWSLEDVTEETAAANPAAPFGIEKVSAEDYLAQPAEETSAKQKASLPSFDSGLSFELMPMEEAVAPQIQTSTESTELWLEGSRAAQKVKTPATAAAPTGETVQKVFVLGASIGGPEAVRDFLGALPAGFPVLFILAQHMGEEFLELMSSQLRKSIALTVRNPTHGEHAGHGDVLIVPTTHRLQIERDGVITLAHLPEKPPYSPSIDMVLRDVAEKFGMDAGAIIFSGMAHDAVEGSKVIKEKGGVVWVQDPDTCVISSMVDGAREAGVVSFVGSPAQLAQKMIAEYSVG